MLQIQTQFYSQGGMFSKAGRHTQQKYALLQKKDEILNGKKRKPVLNSEIKHQFIPNYAKKKTNLEKKIPDENQPFSRQLSRQKVESTKSVKYPAPPIGYYHPRYTNLEKSPQLIWDIQKVYNSQTRPRTARVEASDEIRPIPEKPQVYVKGNVEMNRQAPRDDIILKNTLNPHDSRFLYISLSQSFSKIPRIPSADMSKQLGREISGIYRQDSVAPNYQPNFEVIKKRIGIGMVPFEKTVSRSPVEKRPLTANEDHFEHSKYYRKDDSQLYIPPKGRLFIKQHNREQDISSPLPTFMQKSIHSRIQLTNINQKMLELNNFMDGRFQTVLSSFQFKSNTSQKLFKALHQSQNNNSVHDDNEYKQF